MGRIALMGVAAVIIVELAVLAGDRRNLVAVAGGVAAAVVLIAFRLWFDGDDSDSDATADGSPTEALDRWHARTEVMLSWSEGTRGDWDRHLRPLIAREFQMSTGHRSSKDPAALDASGRMLFGADLWRWVDPSAVTGADRNEPGPGRAALDDILQRLETL